MKKLLENRVVIVKRNTRLDDLIARFNTLGQAKFYIEHLGSRFDDYENEHRIYYASLLEVKTDVALVAKTHVLDRSFLPNFIFGENDIIVVVGQDGLVANTLKYLNGQLLIGINPDRGRWDGVLLPFGPAEAGSAVREAAMGRRQIKDVTMGRLSLQNGQELLAVNDFFIGQKTHASARYLIRYQGREESQSSSGIIVSTGLGSSGWLRSVIAGARGIAGVFSEKSVKKKKPEKNAGVDMNIWGKESLTFSVREPFPSRITGTDIVFGEIPSNEELSIVSHMGENGVIFSDGMEKDYIEFNSGMEARISVSDVRGKIVI
jgi:NAD kinase